MRPTMTVTIYSEIRWKTSVGFFNESTVAKINENMPIGDILRKKCKKLFKNIY